MTTVGFASTHGACAWYRAELPARALARRGYDVRYTIDVDVHPELGAIGFPTDEDHGVDPDVVVLAAGWVSLTEHVIRAAQAAGQRVVADCDDWPWLQKQNPHYTRGGGQTKIAALRAADAVTVSTPYLQNMLDERGIASTVIRNVIDPEPFRWAHTINTDRAGSTWAQLRTVVAYRGLLCGFHDADVVSIRGGLEPGYDWPHPAYRVAHAGADPRGNSFAALAGLDAALVEDRQAVDFDYFPGLLARVDVAVIPFARRDFSRAKSNIAALEWNASGVPWVAARHDEFELLDPAHCVDTPAGWRAAVGRLVADPGYRTEVVEAQTRAIVAEGLTEGAAAAAGWVDRWAQVVDAVSPRGVRS